MFSLRVTPDPESHLTNSYLFTSESVSAGHPDKVADQISDAIVDHFFSEDPKSRVAVETLVTTNQIVVAGEVAGPKISTQELDNLARQVVFDIGYDQEGFSYRNLNFLNLIHGQSADIAQGVDAKDGEEGAGDQGLMFGYATNETAALMPAPIHYAHRILEELDDLRRSELKSDADKALQPDAKSQVTFRYEDGQPVAIDTIVVSTQHHRDIPQHAVKALVQRAVKQALPEDLFAAWGENGKFFVNPTGQFIIGGPDGDTGLTGRKIIVDTYGGAAPHGGGAFSGKDPTKVDRSAAYVARYIAKNIVAAGLMDNCTIQLAYAIGVARPVSVMIDARGSRCDAVVLQRAVLDLDFLTPSGIKRQLDLCRPIYQRTASYGHFGRAADEDGYFPWERLDLVDYFKSLLNA